MPASSRKAKADSTIGSPEAGPAAISATIQARVEAVDWAGVHADLDAQGWAVVPELLTDAETASIAGLYQQEQGFRSRVRSSPMRRATTPSALSATAMVPRAVWP